MKRIKKLLAISLTILMLISSVPAAGLTAFAVEDPLIYESGTLDFYCDIDDPPPSYERFAFFSTRLIKRDGCFGNQLSGESKLFYNELVEHYVENRNYSDYTYTFSKELVVQAMYDTTTGKVVDDGTGAFDSTVAEIQDIVLDAYHALSYDYPENFWFRSLSYSYPYSYFRYTTEEGFQGASVLFSKVVFKPQKIYENSQNDITAFDTAVDTIVNEFETYFAEQGYDITREDKLRYIHDYICNNSAYDYASLEDPTDLAAHSAMPFFIGDKLHVCEGYAKVFKIFCNRLGIPCVCVSGDAGGAHMWNYVQMEDGKWYLVDITWDDQTTRIYYTYFLANSTTKGFNSVPLSEERTERNITDGIYYPALSSTDYISHTHSWGEYDMVKAPTCNEAGEKQAKCTTTLCEGFKSEIIPADDNAHEYTSAITTPATHTEEGVETFTCTVCGDSYTEAIAKLEGHTYEAVVTAPTCTAQGYTTYTCACGDTYVGNYTDKLAHNYTSAITTPATHLNEGVETFTCTVCGYSYTKAVAKLEAHTYNAVVTDPTCTAKGFTTYTCACGDTYKADYTDKLEHSYTSVITTPATHLKEGVETFTCTVCGYSYTKAVAKLEAHTYNAVVTPPTCTAQGYTTYTCACGDTYVGNYTDKLAHNYTSEITTQPTHLTEGVETFTCSACGDTYTESIAKLEGHTYNAVVTPPTCTDKGYTTYACDCGYSYTDDYVNVIAHDYSSAVTTAPTCTAKGVETFTCTACGDSYTKEIDMIAHSEVIDPAVNPTCTDTGLTEGKHCSVCNKVTVAQTIVDALNHDMGEYVQTKAPTCSEKGEQRADCSRCDYYITEEIETTDHTYTSAVTDPTCTAQGYTAYTCACGYSYKDNFVDAKGHSFGDWHETKDATCTVAGEEKRDCSACDTFETRATATIAHSYTSTVTDPTCTDKGYTTYTCACGDTYNDDFVTAKGHSFGDWHEIKAATCTVAGEEQRDCSVCGAPETRATATIPHIYTSVVTAPTCTSEGYTTYTCAYGHSYTDNYTAKTAHDFDGTTCKNCGYDQVSNCSCNCHKGGFMGFIWKIMNFFNKLFKSNKTCACGVSHY